MGLVRRQRRNADDTLQPQGASPDPWAAILLAHVTDVVLLLDAAGRVLHCTPSMRRAFGHDPDALMGHLFGRLLEPAEATRFVEFLRAAVDEDPTTGEDPVAERVAGLRLRHAEGRWCEVEATVRAEGGGGVVAGVVVSIRDVTDR
ncbi:MAG TPA: PAS domain-containing protein, partial [Mycobacteriales bacterium]|nr:PAS domain-containing protein [Mycobacteriales bacterium]